MKRTFLFLALALQTSFAGVRHFTFLYEAPTAAPGSIELENYATTLFQHGFSGIDFRHELELGLTDHLQAGLYFANWQYDRQEGAVQYDSASLEVIYNLTNPAADPLGISLYQELSAGRRAFESETKLIAQKNFGPLILLYNLTLEAEWEGKQLHERTGELQQALGASYELHPSVSVGLELLHEIVLPEWRENHSNLFLGPNISYRRNAWFTTITALRQITNTSEEPDYQVRLIFGVAL